MSVEMSQEEKIRFGIEFWILLFLTFLVPILVIPNGMLNAFNAPKGALILLAVSFLFLLYTGRFLLGKKVIKSRTTTFIWVLILIFFNFASFIYTKNTYFTRIAFLMNVSSLLLFYFFSLNIDRKNVKWFLWAACISGLMVSAITYLQFTGHFILFKGVPKDVRVMGTIGNSNYLGAYLLFPFFISAGLTFISKGKFRIIPAAIGMFILVALLFSRARASWLGMGISFPVFLLILKGIYKFSFTDYIRLNLKRLLVYGIVISAVCVIFWSVAPSKFRSQMKFKNWAYTRSLEYRFKYFRASWWLFKQSPILGEGLWSYRNQVYRAQAEISLKDKEFFNNYKKPQPRRVHNEYLEILNDGGLVAAGFLLIFFSLVLKHGWSIIRDEEADKDERVITATAFCVLSAIMITALFFFPLRVNSTAFMTVLMMGIIEAIYLKRKSLLHTTSANKFTFAYPAIALISVSIIGIIWFGSYKPIKGEIAYNKYREAYSARNAKMAEKYLLEAVSYDPGNSLYCFYTGRLYMDVLHDFVKADKFFEMTEVNFNGDLIEWAVVHTRGILKMKIGSIFQARDFFKKALYYYPIYKPAIEKLNEVEKILKENDRITIKIR